MPPPAAIPLITRGSIAWQACGVPAYRHIAKRANHFSILARVGSVDDQISDVIADFVHGRPHDTEQQPPPPPPPPSTPAQPSPPGDS